MLCALVLRRESAGGPEEDEFVSPETVSLIVDLRLIGATGCCGGGRSVGSYSLERHCLLGKGGGGLRSMGKEEERV